MQWVLEQRLQASRSELAGRGTRPVAEVAWTWGFASPAHFSRTFRRRFGQPPSAV
jgi:AraC-like DNA-binding protein